MTGMINRIKKGLKVVLICAIIPLILSACWEDLEEISVKMGGVKRYAIGDIGPSGVGIVFYVTDGGLHGLEVAPVDQSTGAAWSTITDAFANGSTALPVEIGTGSANTTTIIAQNGGAASAAKKCRDYRAGVEGDWFLPSKNELNELYNNKEVVGSISAYWSSSEYTASEAIVRYFFNGNGLNIVKGNSINVRAVRSF